MASYNKVLLLGNLTRDPEMRVTPKGTAVCQFGLAVNRQFKDESGQMREEVTFVDLESWGKQAETIAKYLTKGRPLFVEGRLKFDQWDDKATGQKRSKLKVVVENFQFIGGREPGASGRRRRHARRGRHRPDGRAPCAPRASRHPAQAPGRPRLRRRRAVLTGDAGSAGNVQHTNIEHPTFNFFQPPPPSLLILPDSHSPSVFNGSSTTNQTFPPGTCNLQPTFIMAHTEVLLLKPVEGLGGEGDQVKVRAGYARNFLRPQKLAAELTHANRKHVDALKKRRAEREATELTGAQELAGRLGKLTLAFAVKTGEGGKMFGAITAADLRAKIIEAGVALDKRKLLLPHPGQDARQARCEDQAAPRRERGADLRCGVLRKPDHRGGARGPGREALERPPRATGTQVGRYGPGQRPRLQSATPGCLNPETTSQIRFLEIIKI